MSLSQYREKRHFNRTPEPAAKIARAGGWSYVIQKHAASHLHYDFRLELDGVLKSWAVPKGPSLDPAVKRLAMEVEDHPVDYGGFEGTIPQGEYGGGTVMLWDKGDWEPIGDPHDGYRDGKLKFQLHGEKLHGGWTLVKTRRAEPSRKNQWLLIKERDDEARSGDEADIVEDAPLSVTTGRDLDAIAAASDRVWNSKPPASKSASTKVTPVKSNSARPAKKTAPRKATAKSATHPAAAQKVPRKAKVAANARGNFTDPDYDAATETFAGVRLTHPEKLLYPDEGITKVELAAYYRDVAEWILPHIIHRPLVLVRCPDGRAKACFYQKHPTVGTPDVLRQIPIRESAGTENYVVVDNVQGLIALAQVGTLEIHAWGSREDKLERPDKLVFDLDPNPDVPWDRVVEGARQIRQFLLDLSLESFLKTTGGKGLHLVVPIDRRHDWDEAKAFCKGVADAVVAVSPDQYTANMSKAARSKKIFLDYLRNGRGATAIVPYSTRARPGATISMPLGWDELSPSIHSDQFTIRNCFERLSSLKNDPWKRISSIRQTLTGPIKMLKKLGVMEG